MIALWAEDGGAVCVHPGAEAISGHAPIAESWRDILGDNGFFDITHQRLSRLEDGGLAVHTGIERIRADDRSALLTVTNVFRKTGDGWKILLHHAAPIHNLATAEGAVH
jgi:ketosteroid isomerase-like protein